jgi:peroxiredoxin (alkyl hydroperoxide reductase subunit C)
MTSRLVLLLLLSGMVALSGAALAGSEAFKESIYPVPELPPTDSELKVKVGDPAPDFTLPAVAGGEMTLSDYQGKHNVILSFVPAAWTPVCSDQWPGYNIAKELFAEHDAMLLGLTVDNIPTLFAWTGAMGELWFPVLSDFWPHGKVAEEYGVLRSTGETERAIFIIDKQGVIRYIDVHDINKRPDLGTLIQELMKLE